MIRKFLALFATMVMATSLTLAGGSPAHAAQGDCPAARLCTWQHINYGGTMWVWNINTISQQPNGCLTVTASAKNQFSSLWANVGIVGTTVVRVWANDGCTGFFQRVYTNTADPNLLYDAPIIALHDDIQSISVTN